MVRTFSPSIKRHPDPNTVNVPADEHPSIRAADGDGDRRAAAAMGDSAIHRAAQRGDWAELSRLLENGADVDAQDKAGYTSIILAAAGGHHYCVNLLVAFRANVNAQNPDKQLKVTGLHCAAIGGHALCVESLIKAGADTSIRDGARSAVKVPPLAVPKLGSCGSLALVWRLWGSSALPE